jgi:hypothetical protein
MYAHAVVEQRYRQMQSSPDSLSLRSLANKEPSFSSLQCQHGFNHRGGMAMFDMDLPWWEFVVRGAVVYLALLVMVRLSGRRTISQLTPFDLLVVMLLSEAVSNGMSGGDNSVGGGLIIAATLIVQPGRRIGHRAGAARSRLRAPRDAVRLPRSRRGHHDPETAAVDAACTQLKTTFLGEPLP